MATMNRIVTGLVRPAFLSAFLFVFPAIGCGNGEGASDLSFTDTGNADSFDPDSIVSKDDGLLLEDSELTAKPDNGDFEVKLECPEPIIMIEEGEEVPPQTTLHLHGEFSVPASGDITSYIWTVDQPEANKFNLIPTMTFPSPTHEVNVFGTYTYCLDVCDEAHCSNEAGCQNTACSTVQANLSNGMHIELTWHTPGDTNEFDEGPGAGSNMDLHLLNPAGDWFDLQNDCFWYNPAPGWGGRNPGDDHPSLDRDDTDGAGPENINYDSPIAGTYRIGVHYWDDNGFGPSYSKVRVYVFGNLVFEWDLLDDEIPMETCDLWEVAEIVWPDGDVNPYLEPDSGPVIIPDFQDPDFVQIGGHCGQ